ncbi:phosphonate ABC transporter, permease protein PhnE [Nocardiopsis akebiae]|uniref:Phosphonate ABC transporter, permease protein PhnE n=1 Tax=Nocardiopsis akebiae TaxID=2831968 RepID=A0ABX8C8F3_9ACTN|nr:phosphonate ABC transporter, permease protein PhnE [Nocardiopsis akebiae]QUX30588.1 phosphonate ABC transporter, permease protein PhnE [Nocardiopsis akebiae]
MVVGFLCLFVGTGIWSLNSLGVNIAALGQGASNAEMFIRRIWPLSLPSAEDVLQQTGITLGTVFLATLLSIALSLPLAVWASSVTTPSALHQFTSRGLIVAARAVPDVVLAILFVRLFGLGALPGILAMGLHSIGMVGKLYADAIEQTAPGPREALNSIGATRAQRLLTAVVPQALPAFIAIGLHRFDINLRVSAVLGIVGVAGIGFEMTNAFARLDFGLGISWALILLLLCLLTEMVSTSIRRVLLRGSGDVEFGAHGFRTRLFRGRRASGTNMPPAAPRTASPTGTARRVSPPLSFSRVRRWLYVVIVVAALMASLFGSGVLETRASAGWAGFATTLGLFWPPGDAGMLDRLLLALLETIQIGLAATFLGALLAVPVGTLAARNISGNRVVHGACRGFVLAVRGLPELVVAIVFVVVIGLGPVAGVFALALGSVGLLGKIVADSLEEIDAGPLEAMSALGSSRTQRYFTAVLPQAAPALIGGLLYQLDVNIRSATLLGLVGAGGVGFYLLQATQTREYEVITLITLMTFTVVFALELVSMLLRRLVR